MPSSDDIHAGIGPLVDAFSQDTKRSNNNNNNNNNSVGTCEAECLEDPLPVEVDGSMDYLSMHAADLLCRCKADDELYEVFALATAKLLVAVAEFPAICSIGKALSIY